MYFISGSEVILLSGQLCNWQIFDSRWWICIFVFEDLSKLVVVQFDWIFNHGHIRKMGHGHGEKLSLLLQTFKLKKYLTDVWSMPSLSYIICFICYVCHMSSVIGNILSWMTCDTNDRWHITPMTDLLHRWHGCFDLWNRASYM